jgi:hypothetical protein
MAASFFIACADSRTSLPHSLGPSTIKELAATARRCRHPRQTLAHEIV